MKQQRTARVRRTTSETDISVRLLVDGGGLARIRTGIGFMDHMLGLLAHHAMFDLAVSAKGDLHVDDHHTVEDLGLVLGTALNEALGDRKGIRRYGWALVPMDESLGEAAVDLGGRPYLVLEAGLRRKKAGSFDLGLVREFLRAFTVQGRMALHLELRRGDEPHHAYEALFKAMARALREACSPDSLRRGVPSSKGKI